MKDKIKEKILREIEDNLIEDNRSYDERDIKKAIEETSKAKDKEFLEMIDKIKKEIEKVKFMEYVKPRNPFSNKELNEQIRKDLFKIINQNLEDLK